MESGKAICPACKKEIQVNPTEVVDVCPDCGKAFSTKNAIELYQERQEELRKQEEERRRQE